MANPNAPFSFRPWASARVHEYPLSTGYSMALYLGDLVKTDGSNNIVTAAAGDQVRGVFAGVKYIASDGSFVFKKNWVASTTEQSGSIIKALVWDDPNQAFLAQSVGSMTNADVGQFVNVDTSTAGTASLTRSI